MSGLARITGIAFARADGPGDVVIETTRPELLVGCVALVAHPDDERYQPLFGTTVRTPLFDVEVPVVAHALAEPEKGTGIAMICTFGDTTDVIWWRELQLPDPGDHRPRRPLRLRGARMAGRPMRRREAYGQLAGKTVRRRPARSWSSCSTRPARSTASPEQITHPVKFYEKGDRPLEIVTTRQWYIRNGGRSAELRDALLARGRELAWHPPYMRQRYENWVDGLNGDWLVSRQRFFGVPVPALVPARRRTAPPKYDDPLLPDDASLPDRPAVARPARVTSTTSAAGPAASSATPTSWTPGPRRR